MEIGQIEQGDILLCTVDRIIGTTVFVKIDSLKGNTEGTIITSEIAPGRIRNLREYVVPKKKIVCKVIKISGNRIELSLRRVTPKETKEIMEQFKLEKSYQSIIKSILRENSDKIIQKIKEEDSLYNFINEAKESPKNLEKIAGKEDAKKILEIIKETKDKQIEIKRTIEVNTIDPEGLELIKDMFQASKNVEVRYISAGKYSLKMVSDDFKKANQEMKKYLEKIESSARERNLNITIKEK